MKGLLIITCILFLFSCKEKFDTKTYQENKVNLAQRESEHPEQFLKVSSNDKKNLFGATVIKGKIVNTASVSVYKNTRIKMLCYKNGIQVEEHEDVMSDIIKPGTVRNFKIKYHLPKGTDSLALSVMSAEAVNDSSLSDLKK
ncbi:MAG: hypothetical protein ABI405_12775 [Parafilimonas sp.]